MRVLTRKTLRDLRGSVGVLASVVVIIAVGTGSFIALRSSQYILEASQRAYYNRYAFADLWVEVKKAPLSALTSIRDIPGIARIESRVVLDVILDVPGVDQPLTGRLISMPTESFDETINGIHLVRGSGFSGNRDEEVILADSFAQAHGLQPGDHIDLILNRKQQSFVIVGTAISPEFVYAVRGQGDITPDPEHFGVLYIQEHYARELLDFQDAFNQLIGHVVPGHHKDIEFILERIDRMLDPYGVLATTPRERQASHRFLSDEIHGLRVAAWIMPTIFLCVAALVLNVLMSRLAERQRTVIGTLKALGYSDRQVLMHFISFGVAVGTLGGIGGMFVGVTLAAGFIQMYRMFFQFPEFLTRLYPSLLGTGLLISVLFSIAGTAKGVWRVLKLHPAEAMRPRPPETGTAMFLERFPAIWRRLGFRTHIALRSLARNRGRTATGVVSAALAIAIILTSLVMRDSVWFLVDFQFERVSHSDVTIAMRDERSIEALWEARDLPGVDYAEPVLGLTCDLRNGRYARRMAITGLSPEHRLLTPMLEDLTPIPIPPEGLVMTRKLAEILNVRVGDRLLVTPVRGRRETGEVWVASIVDGFMGLECYAALDYLSRLVGEDRAVNSIQMSVDPSRMSELYQRLKELPNAQAVSVRATAKANIEKTLIRSMSFSMSIMIGFAGVIAFGSMLNASLIEIADRTRDIASFRVLGYRPGQIAGIFFRQALIVLVLGLVLAMPIAWAIVNYWVQAYQTELFRIPVLVRPGTVLLSGALALGFVLISQAVAYREIRRLDWLEGIKIKE